MCKDTEGVEFSRSMLEFYLNAMDLVDPDATEFIITLTENEFSIKRDDTDDE